MRRTTALIALLLAFAMVAASCGDDDTSADDDTGSTTTTGAPSVDQPDPVDPDADPTTTTTPATAPDVELTASAPGITETTIRLGVAIPDVSTFSNSGDIPGRYRAVADEINANGGVLGRQLELVVAEWDLLDSAGFDAACVELTEDTEVFAVVTRTPANFGAMTCFTELGNTIVVNALDLDSVEESRSDGLLFSTLSDRFGALLGGVDLLADELADATVAIATSTEGGGEAQAEDLESALVDLGIDVAVTTIGTVAYSDDPAAALAEQDRFAEIWNSEGVTHVIGVGNAVVGAAYAIDNNALPMTLITPNLGVRTLNSLGAVLANLEMIGLAAPDPGIVAEEGLHRTPECIALMEEALGETVIFFPEEEELNALPSGLGACASFDFLVAALEAAGPNPTQADFLAVTNAGLSFDMTGAGSASVAADKAYMNSDPGLVYDWDGEAFSLPRLTNVGQPTDSIQASALA